MAGKRGQRNGCWRIYKHTMPDGSAYIGMTGTDPESRWRNGFGYSGNKEFFRGIIKCGWDSIKHEIIVDGLTKEEAIDREREEIYKSSCDVPTYNIVGNRVNRVQKRSTSDAEDYDFNLTAYFAEYTWLDHEYKTDICPDEYRKEAVDKIIGMFRPCVDEKAFGKAKDVILCFPEGRTDIDVNINVPVKLLIEDYGFTEDEAVWFLNKVHELDSAGKYKKET